MAVSDPTLEFLRDIENPALYQINDNIPHFVAHKRKFRDNDGKVHEIEVTEDDLQEIADNYNRKFAATGTPAVIKLGHVRPKEGERSQPPIVGAATRFRIGTFGPQKKKCLLYKSHLRLDWLPEIKRGGYGFRSPEYYPGKKEITAIALLNRDPELDLGFVTYAAGSGICTIKTIQGGLLCYSRELNMEPTTPPDPNAAPPEVNDDEEMQAYLKHCYSHPYAAKMLAKYSAAAAPGVPGPTDVNAPGQPPMQFARQEDAVAYARAQDTIKRERAARVKAEQALAAVTYRNELQQLATDNGVQIDIDKEMCRVACYSRQQFDAHKEMLVEHFGYARDDITSQPWLYQKERPAGSAKEGGDRNKMRKAVDMATKTGKSYDECLAVVNGVN